MGNHFGVLDMLMEKIEVVDAWLHKKRIEGLND